MKINNYLSFFLLVIMLSVQGCYILEDDSDDIDNQIRENQKNEIERQKLLDEYKRKEILKNRAVIINDNNLDEREVEINGLISALSTDGTNIAILTDTGSIYLYNPENYSTKFVFNIEDSVAYYNEDIKLRKAFFFYLYENIYTVGFYQNIVVDINSTKTKYKYIERKYYRDGEFLEDLDEPIVKQNLAKPGYNYQYRVDRTSVWREPQSSGNKNGGGSGDGIEVFRKSINSEDSKNVGWSGLTIIHDYAWVGSS